jgi:hypothetical protein
MINVKRDYGAQLKVDRRNSESGTPILRRALLSFKWIKPLRRSGTLNALTNTRFAAVDVHGQERQASRRVRDCAAAQPADALQPAWVTTAPSESVAPPSLMSSVALPLL